MNDYGYNSYNKSLNQGKRSNTALMIFLFLFSLLAAGFLSAFIYFDLTEKYDAKLKNINAVLETYQTNYKKNTDKLNNLQDVLNQISAEYDIDVNKLNKEIASLSTSYEDVSQQVLSLGGDFNISETARKVSPSVIGIKVYVPSQKYNNFWSTRASVTEGSGIILTTDGYIVTNYHVISSAVEYDNAIITVVLTNGKECSAKVIGGDEQNDLAVIKIEENGLTPATLGKSSDSNIGDFVIAIGNPLGLDLYGSVTFGIVSGLNRKINEDNVAEELIQTDAAINAGNSGGALINYKGEIIGINTIKIADSNVEGLGFAIPIDYAKPLIDSIIKYGYVKDRPTLGITGYDISQSVANYYGVPQGVLVTGYESGITKSNFMENDIITEINGNAITTMKSLETYIKTLKIGDNIKVSVYRGDRSVEFETPVMEKR